MRDYWAVYESAQNASFPTVKERRGEHLGQEVLLV